MNPNKRRMRINVPKAYKIEVKKPSPININNENRIVVHKTALSLNLKLYSIVITYITITSKELFD